ncbi:MAG: diguanylate cyclase [Pyrinomonadaceae bacterium]
MPEFFIDIRSVAFALMLVTGLMAMVLYFVLRAQKTYPGTGYWVLSNFAGTLGFLCLGLRGYIPDLIALVIGNTLAVGATALALEGNRRFLELKPDSFVPFVFMSAYAITITFYTYIDPSETARIIVSSIVASGLTFLSFRAFAEKPGIMKNVVYRTAAMTFLLFSVLMALRMVATMSFTTIGQIYAPVWIQSVSFMMFLIFATVWTLNYVVLNSERLNEELRAKEAELLEKATTDFLTGLSNKRAFDEFASSEIKRSRRYNLPACLVLLDLDHFKNVNDTFGHTAGDKVLAEIGALLKRMTRQHDLIARVGGEEFGLLLTHTDIESGHAVAEAFRREIQQLEIQHSAINLSVTSSFGVAELRESDTLDSLKERADRYLYRAKDEGRNRVVSEASSSGKKGLRLLSQA